MRNFALVIGIGLYAAFMASAQESPLFAFSVGAGFTEPVNNSGSYLDTGWNVAAGGGINITPYVGAMIDLGYSSFGINSATLSNIGVPGGGVHIFSATLDPIIHLNPHGHFDVYLTGGGGLFHYYQDFTQPSAQTVLGVSPFFGVYPTVVPTTQILASNSTNKPGIDAGLGVSMGTKWHGKLFAEARWDRMFLNNGYHMDYLPVTFGFRW
jgi:hypothetical protein